MNVEISGLLGCSTPEPIIVKADRMAEDKGVEEKKIRKCVKGGHACHKTVEMTV